jgi:L-ascorbate metabolism protein UlaG (beta-lactamase superfamily)
MNDDNRTTGSDAWKQAGNNEHMLSLQGDLSPSSPGDVIIDYYGHSALKVTSPAGLTMMIDPWRNDPSGAFGLWFTRDFSRQVVDVCLSTHAHFDHDALYHVEATSVLDRAIGEWRFADVRVTGVPDKHALSSGGFFDLGQAVRQGGADPEPPNNPGHLDMVTYVIETGGIRVLFWGDNRHEPPEAVWRRWGAIDVLTLPIDGSDRVLNPAQIETILTRLKPKVVIPIHYAIEGMSSALNMLRSAEDWVSSQKSRRLAEGGRLTLNAADIAGKEREVHYFGNHIQG